MAALKMKSSLILGGVMDSAMSGSGVNSKKIEEMLLTGRGDWK